MHKIGAMIASLLLAATAHADELTVRDFLENSHTDPQDLRVIAAAASGIRTLNIYLDVTRPDCEPVGSRACRLTGRRLQSKVFCAPVRMELPPERIRDIAEKYLDKRPDEAEQPSGLYPLVILNALVERFPCKPGLILNAMKGE
ncbi:hypothetical protein [Rhizobium sp. RAF56]|jgi:hypothetical protein|uniref:hypothetical protein n=1 Tax=Rhizobium sp. RAF56 TaxID=3233062 RepID=UPI003F95FEDB